MGVSNSDQKSNRDDELVRLLTTHKRQLFGLIFALVHSVADAEDVFQQTCLVMWEKFDQFEPETDFVAWAGSIARFKAIDMLRARKRQRVQFSPTLLEQLAEQSQSRPEHYEARAEALEGCKEKLSSRDRQTLQACYEQGTTIKQAAAKLKRPVGSVYDSLSRIRRALLACIEHTLEKKGYA